MVLNFFQLRNYTDFTFQLTNIENPRDNYIVGPRVTDARGDMWLAQGDGRQGVSILTFSDGSPIRQFLFMWDQNWALRYRVGGEAQNRHISVNGNKDFSIDVHDTYFKFICYRGTFDGVHSEVTVHDWKDLITNAFLEAVNDLEILRYARQFSDSPNEELRESRVANIQLPNDRQKQNIMDLVATWIDDYLEHNRGQRMLYGEERGWRIDLQDNGAVQRNGMYFYNLAVQYQGGANNVYAHIMLPVGYVIGRRRIRNAFLRSMETSEVVIIFPPENDLLSGIPYTSDQARNSWAVRSLEWMCLRGTASIMR
eukprot:c22099_g1_i1 orf=275-1207(-)